VLAEEDALDSGEAIMDESELCTAELKAADEMLVTT
jgi:hypothetical protein